MDRARDTLWRGRPAWLLAGGGLEAVVTATGASLACLRRQGEELNPLWQPGWPAAVQPDPALHGDPQGEGLLLASAVGSMLCLDRFGATLPAERRPFHGEAAVIPWSLASNGAAEATCVALLPEAGLRVQRSFRLSPAGCRLETTVASADGRDHAVEWCEHITLGDPFCDGIEIAAGLDRADRIEPAPLDAAPAAMALTMPRASDPPRGDLWSGAVDDGFWRATNRRLGRSLEVRWDRDAFPWLVVWTEHRSRGGPPWSGRERARGLELSTKPFPCAGPYPWAERHGRPAQRIVPASTPLRAAVSFAWSATD